MRARLPAEVVVGVVFVAAMFVNILDTTIVNVALPSIAHDFGIGIDQVDAAVVGYLVSLAVWIPASGWIGDRFGTKRTFLFALAAFTAASALCGFAQDMTQLVVFRVLQGVGGGMLAPIGTAMLWRTFPPNRRAAASRVLMIPTVMAPALGPVLGGVLVDSLSWRWVFFVNVPVGVAALFFGATFLTEHREAVPGRFDATGFVLSALGLSLALYALSEGPSQGWASAQVLVTGAVGLIALAVLVPVELRRARPMVDLRLLAERSFRRANVIGVPAIGGFIGLLFAIPLFVQQARGESALTAGLTVFPEALGVLCATQIVGRLYPYVGPRRLLLVGTALVGVGALGLTFVGLGTSLWAVRGLMVCVGFGMGSVFLPLQTAAFANVSSSDTGRASAFYNAQRQVAAALGVALLATVLSIVGGTGAGSEIGARAFHAAFLTAAGLAFVGWLLSWRVRDADAASTMVERTPAPSAQPVAVSAGE